MTITCAKPFTELLERPGLKGSFGVSKIIGGHPGYKVVTGVDGLCDGIAFEFLRQHTSQRKEKGAVYVRVASKRVHGHTGGSACAKALYCTGGTSSGKEFKVPNYCTGVINAEEETFSVVERQENSGFPSGEKMEVADRLSGMANIFTLFPSALFKLGGTLGF